MFLLSQRLRPACAIFAVLAGIAVVTGAQGQPTGNPKGTVAPPETSVPKAGSGSRPPAPGLSGADGGKLVGNEAQTRARMQGSTSPGSGTEGGLSTKRQGASTGDGPQSDKGSASPRPVSPTL